MTSLSELANLRVAKVMGVTSATANTETTHAHGLVGALIVGVIPVPETTATPGVPYISTSTVAAGFDSTNIYIKTSTAVAGRFTAYILYLGGQG